MRRPALLAAIVILAGSLPASGAVAQERPSLPDIEDEVMCPICGTALNLSESPQAERERAFIREMIAAGASKQQILDALVAEYGPEVLATPDAEGFDLIGGWIAPGAAILIAAGGIAVGVRRWRSAGRDPIASEAKADPEYDERLTADLSRYDL